MCYKKIRNKSIFVVSMLLFLIMFGSVYESEAGNPNSAFYSSDNNRIFWFIMISDIHIGARGVPGSENLRWMVTEAKDVINPSFIVSTGDLTESTNWSELGVPDGPHLEEWQEYRSILIDSGMDADFYYDIPGNHDHFGDKFFLYYLNYSIQGSDTGQTQMSWTRTFDFGTYHFLGVNTSGNDGAEFSALPPTYGDNSGLDDAELAYIEARLEENNSADLTMIFGHHLIVKRSSVGSSEDVENSTMTALSYGADEFIALMEKYNVLMYGYGHSHDYREEFFTKDMSSGVIYLNVASLAKSDKKHYNIVAIDSNGISTAPQNVETWPAVVITTPLDKNLGMENNPYTSIPVNYNEAVPIRALVFDKVPVTTVEYRIYEIIDEGGEIVKHSVAIAGSTMEGKGIWHPMAQVGSAHQNYPYLWEANSEDLLSPGDYTIEVRAKGSTTQTDSVPTRSPASPVNDEGCFIYTTCSGI